MPSSTNCSETRTPPTDRRWSQPPLLFAAGIFAVLLVLIGRGVLPTQDSPAFCVSSPSGVRIFLGEGFPSQGVHQFSDGMSISGVIKLTMAGEGGRGRLPEVIRDDGLVDGMALAIEETTADALTVRQSWMPARQRLALGIPLHPDRMSRDDWVTLPGVGEKMADRIENDRQNYGDFGGFEALERVKGIGPAKLNALRPYFQKSS